MTPKQRILNQTRDTIKMSFVEEIFIIILLSSTSYCMIQNLLYPKISPKKKVFISHMKSGSQADFKIR